jgi:hypothetical protein
MVAPAAPPVPAAAVEAFAKARALRGEGALPDDPAVAAALESARNLCPDWIAPQRFADDLLLAAGRGPEALDARRAASCAQPDSGGLRYLCLRLEGVRDPAPFEAALNLAPDLAWAHHGLAWCLARGTGDVRALVHARRALALARGPWEQSFFSLALASTRRGFGHEQRAVDGLRLALPDVPNPDLPEPSDLRFLVDLARFELESPEASVRAAGLDRGLDLLCRAGLHDDELASLTGLLARVANELGRGEKRLELALASQPGSLRRELRAQRLLLRSGGALAVALHDRDARLRLESSSSALRRLLSLRRGLFSGHLFAEALEVWLADQPAQTLGDDGLPERPVVREVLLAARSLAAPPSGAQLARLGQALLHAGWFPEAEILAEAISRHDLSAALELREAALAGQVLFSSLARTFVEGTRLPEAAEELPSGNPAVLDLDGLLSALARHFARAAPWLADEGDPADLQAELLATSRIEYGPFATVLHPGPVFSAADERAGLGRRGEPVPGLPAALERHGRVALVGTLLGGGAPDGTLLRLLSSQQRIGEHLGTPWRGSVFFCEGADLASRAGRSGARIAGAALHEGYWVDIAVVRRDRDAYAALRARFKGPRAKARLGAALQGSALALQTPGAADLARRRERLAIHPLLGEQTRLRLAIMRDRAGPSELLGEVTLSELVDIVALHEEGHLCDRTRFLPLAEHLPEVLSFALSAGLVPRAIHAELELRAQLTALCVAPDPRLPLVELLHGRNSRGSSGLPHGAAYEELLRRLLDELDLQFTRAPKLFARLDECRRLVHQLHRLSPEQVRNLALGLARRMRLGPIR